MKTFISNQKLAEIKAHTNNHMVDCSGDGLSSKIYAHNLSALERGGTVMMIIETKKKVLQ